jgi:alginate O-acetyltransferase complex protein AlgI
MLFNEPAFLFFFLPLVLLGYFALSGTGRPWARNLWLAAASLVFYLWREKVGLLLAPVLLDYLLGRWVGATRDRPSGRWAIRTAVGLNLALLVWFKYVNFFVDNASAASAALGGPAFHLKAIALPLGISFLTFHGISYLVDIRRGDAPAANGFLDTLLYLAFFPKLIAGPIVKYQDFAAQLGARRPAREDLAAGMQRIVVGLAKKTILAGTLETTVNQVFVLPFGQLTPAVAWLGVAAYALQLYLDFSGYSDMAIGLARLFGFRFQENFNYPYVSKSITEFWRRWHISLSIWFRDYLFFPLGANRRGNARGYLNLLIVFVLCGFWHGANWTFLAWGLWQGVFLVLERAWLGRRLARLVPPLQHGYALLVMLAGWAVFRCASLGDGFRYLKCMAGFPGGPGGEYPLALFLDPRLLLAGGIGIIASTPALPALRGLLARLAARRPRAGALLQRCWAVAGVLALAVLLVASSTFMAARTHNPFLYFKF